MGRTFILLLGIASSVAAYGATPAWPEITAEMRPWCYNWWMGSAVDEEGLRLQARQMEEAGLGGFHIVPIYEAKDKAHKPVAYLSEEWMRLFAVAKASGGERNLGTDMTTGCGWNFGGPHTAPEQGVWRIARLGANDAALKGGRVLWRGKDADGREIRLEAVPTGRQVDRAPRSWKGPMIDPCSASVMRTYLEPFTREFTRPGASKPRCLYHDSYSYHETSWSPELAAAFREKRGYRLEEHYAELAGIGDADTVARVKHDYRETISDMIVDNFARWTEWAHGLGINTRNQAHGAPANLLDLYAVADIPETEMFSTAQNILMSKFASSVAHVKGTRLVASESCTWVDEHFCETLDACKRFIDNLFLSGVNHVFYHGWCYSPAEVAWPGWCYYATWEMNPRNPVWRDARTLSDWIARTQSLAQTSEPDEDVLLYWPVHDIWRKPEGFAEQFVLLDAGRWLDRSEFGRLARRLYDSGVSFDYISDRQLLSLPEKGRTHYTTIVVPPCRTIPLATAERLGELSRKGYTVVCVGERPYDVPGFIRPETPDAVAQALKGVADAQEQEIGRREPFAGDSGLAYRRMRRGNDTLYYLVNRSRKKVAGTFKPTAVTAAAWVLDPMGGTIRRIGVEDGAVRLTLESGESTWLWCTPAVPAGIEPVATVRKYGEPSPIVGEWRLEVVCGGPEGAFAARAMETLSSWSRNKDGTENPFCGTVLYKAEFDWNDTGCGALLDLGKVCHSARVRMNGHDLGVRIMPPYRFAVPAGVLKRGTNTLEVDVTNTGANRLRDLDKRKVDWRYGSHPGVIGRNYKPFDAAGWPLAESGLFGPVSIAAEITAASTPKALVIMLDGLRGDAVENLGMTNLLRLVSGEWQPGYRCAWSFGASTIRDGSTESAPNHVAIATGMTVKRTGIAWNSDLIHRGTSTGALPTWLARLAKARPGTRPLHIFSWYGDLRISPDYGVKFIFDRDDTNARDLAKIVARDDAPDAIMWYIDRPDHAGHGFGYYPYTAQYRAAAKTCDDEIGGVLDAIASRRTFAEEDWLVVVTADHGGWERYHGQQSTQCYTIPLLVVGRHVQNGRIPGVPHNYDAAPMALAHFGIDVSKIDFDGKVRGGEVAPPEKARPLKDSLVVYLPFDGQGEAYGAYPVELRGAAKVLPKDGRFGGALRVSSSTNETGCAFLKGTEALPFENGAEFSFALWVRTFGGQSGDPVVLCNKDWSAGSKPGIALIASRHVDMSRTSGYNFKAKKHHSPGFMLNCGREGGKRHDLGVYNPDFGEWVFYAGTRGEDGVVRLYQGRGDGYLYCVADDLSDIAFKTGLPFFIGQDGTGRYRHPFVGDVDDVAIWTRALTHEEVKRIWRAGKPLGELD